MRLTELIEELQALIPDDLEDLEVGFCYDYGDHWHTPVVETIKSVDRREVAYSDYHSMNKLLDDGSGDGCKAYDDTVKRKMIILR